MPRVIALPRCPACGGEEFADEHLGGDAHLRRCVACDTVSAGEYADPSDVYVDGYLKGETAFGLDLRDPGFQEYLAMVAGRRVRAIERAVGGPGSLLDVGCGTGEVMVAARERGWTVRGVEPIEDASREAREARGLDVRTARLEESGLPERSHDVVGAFHVLEHMPDTRGFLRTLARWARPGGHVAIEVPNYDSALRRHTCADWSGLRPLEHVAHFTAPTLSAAFRRAGLQPVSVRTLSYVGPPQDLEFALWDLGKIAWRQRLAPLCRRRAAGAEVRHDPTRAGWALVHGIERISNRRRHGLVVLGIARVPGWRKPRA